MEKEKLFDKLVINEIKTQSDFLADKIKEMIVSRELDDGFVFPNENEFCKKLNVSRSTLREAYKILDTQGFIRRTKHGTYIKCREDIAKQGNFMASLELADNRELIEFVCALEPEAVFLAAKNIDEEGITRLEALMNECEEVADNWRELLVKNYEFHAYIRSLANNNLITSALTAYYDIFNQQIIENIYSRSTDTSAFRKESLQQHRELFHAIKNHEAEKAKNIAYDHLSYDIYELQFKTSKN
ncbi:FadR/GntR family transcriptional regulator [Aminipila luticellarii]|nr:FCD domain-containing protein [Aminipila luticellarii]